MDRFKYIIGILLSVCLITSCSEEEILNYNNKASSNEPFRTLTINYNTPAASDITVSRAASEIPQDFYVTDLYIYVFDYASSSLLSVDADNNPAPSYLSGEALDNGISGKQEMKGVEDNKYNSSWARIKVKSEAFGKSVRIYMIANASSYSDILTHDELMNITEEKELKDMICTYKDASSAPNRTNILMSGNGSLTGDPEAIIPLYIDESGRILMGSAAGENALILLERAEARVNFNFKSGSNCTFTPTGYKIYNYPKLSYMFWKYILQIGGSTDYEKIRGKDASQKKEHFFEGPIEIETTGNFTFYMPENLKYPGFKDHGGIAKKQQYLPSSDGYKFRETRKGDGWKNAPKLATYVEVNGVFKGYSEKLKKDVTANVKYTVHLGFSKRAAGSPDNDVNDYFTKRNYEYTYNITVNGVDNIALEVTNGKEESAAIGEGEIMVEESITLSNTATSETLNVNKNEMWTIEEPEDNHPWLKIAGTPVTDWVVSTAKTGSYALTADELPKGMNSRQLVLLATRTSTDERSKIIRRITITQQQVP